jgi:LDH2 family malate/lactate/ureidoglycolate dehydrogenase
LYFRQIAYQAISVKYNTSRETAISLLISRDSSRSRTHPVRPAKASATSGDPEREAERIRSKEGIPLLKAVVDDLMDISRKTGIEFKSS